MKKRVVLREYGVISEGENGSAFTNGVEIDSVAFENLIRYLDENSESSASKNSFRIFRQNKRNHIRVTNYVGVIETRDGTTVEILPKIYGSDDNSSLSIAQTKLIFTRMLSHLSDMPFVHQGQANLAVADKYPMLEVFISSYLESLDELIRKGIRGGYQSISSETRFVRGKIVIAEQVRRNMQIKGSFYCEYDEFVANIAPNRLIKSTLIKLQQLSKSSKNHTKILKYLEHFEVIDFSHNVDDDLNYCGVRRKFLLEYGHLLLWSEIFLKNRKFTNFQGDTINQAVLFPMEKLFENYISMLVKKNWTNSKVQAQDKRLFLVSQLNHQTGEFTKELFRLKPDIVIDEGKVILDTKWKILDENKKSFSIGEADLYQMNAYGRRYQLENKEGIPPRLGLIYPKSSNSESQSLHFAYGGDMELQVFSFDLLATDQNNEINKILDNFKLEVSKT